MIAVNPDGERQSLAGLNWSLVKIERNYQWYRNGSSWNYEPVTFTKAVANGKVDATADKEAEISVAVDWGRYRLEIETADPAGPASSFEFDAGWYVEATSTETPDGLEIALDKDSYAPGDVAKLKVSPRFAGELLVTVGAESLLATQTATVPEGGATIDIPVDADWGAGAYVTATLYRPGEAQEIAHAGPRHRREMAEGRSRRAQACRDADAAGKDRAAPDAVDPGERDRRCRRQATPMSWSPPSMSASST